MKHKNIETNNFVYSTIRLNEPSKFGYAIEKLTFAVSPCIIGTLLSKVKKLA